jgi:hypothetical protein
MRNETAIQQKVKSATYVSNTLGGEGLFIFSKPRMRALFGYATIHEQDRVSKKRWRYV